MLPAADSSGLSSSGSAMASAIRIGTSSTEENFSANAIPVAMPASAHRVRVGFTR
jgi:hypothetical protein